MGGSSLPSFQCSFCRLKAHKAQLQRQGDVLARESKDSKGKMLAVDDALKDYGKVSCL
jgi:hypothetical protein